MGEIPDNSPLFTSLRGAAQYHFDVVESVKEYFRPESPNSLSRFDAFSGPRVVVRAADYIKETDLRSSLLIMISIEAAFRQDYQYRCRKRLKDDLSRAFRETNKRKLGRVNLEKTIFDAWSRHAFGAHQIIGELRGAFNFRNWLAHGRYGTPRLGRNYNFDYLYRLADAVYTTLPLCGMDEA